MSYRNERILFLFALVISLIALVLIYIVGLEIFAQPEQAEYVIRTLLYLFGLVSIRGVWKLTLDKKIKSKEERQNED